MAFITPEIVLLPAGSDIALRLRFVKDLKGSGGYAASKAKASSAGREERVGATKQKRKLCVAGPPSLHVVPQAGARGGATGGAG